MAAVIPFIPLISGVLSAGASLFGGSQQQSLPAPPPAPAAPAEVTLDESQSLQAEKLRTLKRRQSAEKKKKSGLAGLEDTGEVKKATLLGE